jgi:hypothetical protein
MRFMPLLIAADFPDPPQAGLWTRYVLENPWPVSIVLLAAGLIAAWLGLRDGRRDRIQLAAAAAGLAILIASIGSLVTTSGEHGRHITRRLVEAVIAGDHPVALALFAPDASLAFGSMTNPGIGLEAIADRLERLARRHTIASNRITRLRGYPRSAGEAEVHLACWTDAGMGYTPSQWVVHVARQPDGSWRVRRITCLSINGQAPSLDFDLR